MDIFKLENDNCFLEISEDIQYKFNSMDNRKYDLFLNPRNFSEQNRDYKTILINITSWYNDYSEYNIAVIVFDENPHPDGFIDGEIITLLINELILQINVVTGEVIKCVVLDCYPCTFKLIRLKTGYLVHGILDIEFFDLNFEKKWIFSQGEEYSNIYKESVVVNEEANRIYIFDFYDNYFELDFDGNLIKVIYN